MKTQSIFLLLVLSTLLECNKKDPGLSSKWRLTFQDEFNDSNLNRKIWKTIFPWRQVASDDYLLHDSAFTLKNGILNIEAKKDTLSGLVHNGDYNYFTKQFYLSSGMLQSGSYFAQQYGYFETRARMPFGSGYWPAFWLMSNNSWPPEIDVFEISGREPNRAMFTNHFMDTKNKKKRISKIVNGPDFSLAFHTFGIDWNPEEITWYIDGIRQFSSTTGIPNEKMYIVLSLYLNSDFAGYISEKSPMPGLFEVDYVRVYERIPN